MAGGKLLTQEEKELIEELYRNGESADCIGEMVQRAPQTIRNYLDAAGLKPIHHTKGGKTGLKKSRANKCPHCGTTGHFKGARFCYRCGKDIRTESVVLAERLRTILGDIKFLPDNARAEASDTIQDVIRYLEKQEA